MADAPAATHLHLVLGGGAPVTAAKRSKHTVALHRARIDRHKALVLGVGVVLATLLHAREVAIDAQAGTSPGLQRGRFRHVGDRVED